MIPAAVIEVRREICARCDQPCAQAATINHADPAAACPRAWSGRWGRYGNGLGDQVAKVAQPIARVIDAVARTNLANCGSCKQRQAALNALVPDVSRPLARPIPAPGTPSAR